MTADSTEVLSFSCCLCVLQLQLLQLPCYLQQSFAEDFDAVACANAGKPVLFTGKHALFISFVEPAVQPGSEAAARCILEQFYVSAYTHTVT